MAASLDDLKAQIESAERTVNAADARAHGAARLLKAHWRARGPTIVIGAASALLALQLVRGRGRARRRAAAGPPGSWASSLEPLLKHFGPRLIPTITALVAGLAAKKAKRPLVTAPAVDLQRYAGTWYEIARLPEKYERDCASDVTATYGPTIDGGLRIVNRCRRRDGSIRRAIGRAEVVDRDSNARLRVTFAPRLLDPLPFVWSDYCIMDVASDYSMAVVGTPDRSHLWLLAREPTVIEEVRSAFIAKALGQGFDTSLLVYGPHTAREGAAGVEDTSTMPPVVVEPSRTAAAPRSARDEAIPATDHDRVATRLDDQQH